MSLQRDRDADEGSPAVLKATLEQRTRELEEARSELENRKLIDRAKGCSSMRPYM